MTLSHRQSWAISLLIPVAVFFLVPEMDIVSPKTPLFFAITVWAITAWILEVLPSAIVAAIMTFLYTLLISKPSVTFSAWCTFLPWLAMSALVIGEALSRTGFGKRLALYCMIMLGGSFKKTLFGMMVAGLILSLLMPSQLGRVVIFVAITQGILDALNIDHKSKLSSAFIMAAYFAGAAPGFFCVSASSMNLMAVQVVINATGNAIKYTDFLVQMAPFAVFYTAFSFLLVFVIRGKERLENEDDLKHVLRTRLAEMGPISKDEIKIFLILLTGFLGFFTEQWHHKSGAFIFALVGMLCFLPGINLSTAKELKKLNFPFLIFLAACMSIGAVATDLKIPNWLAANMATVFTGTGPYEAITFSYVLGVVVNFLMTPMAAVGALGVPLAELGTTLGYEPYTLVYALLYGLDQALFPYEIGFFLYIFSTGAVSLKHIMGPMFIRMVAFTLLIPAILVPYWKLIGFIQ